MEPLPFENPKNLQEADPLFLDAVLATSFDWKELANRLSSAGRVLPAGNRGILRKPQVVYRMANTACRLDCGFSRDLTDALNALHRKLIDKVEGMELDALCACVQEVSLRNRAGVAGLLWALGTSGRHGVRKIARIFLHRIMTELFAELYRAGDDGFERLMKSAGATPGTQGPA